MNIQGRIKVIKDTQVISDKFKKREFVVETSGEYPQYIQLECTQDKTSILDTYKVGDSVDVSINIRGREWTKDGVTKYFNTIEAWRIEKVDAVAPQAETVVEGDLPF